MDNKLNKFVIRLIIFISFAVYLLLFVILIKNEFFVKEGFNTYFRQTIRPQIRNIKDMGRALGLF
jgi:hypothetical protein